jgi:hypothetical protein
MINKKGQLGLTIISIIFFWIIAFACVNFIMPEATTASAALNCDSSTISGGNMFLCLMVDTTVGYFIITIISVVLGAITARLLL